MRSIKLKLLLSLVILTTVSSPKIAIAGAGHDHSGASSFKSGGEATGAVTVDADTVKRLGIKVEPVKNQPLDIGLKTTGQIETLPDQKVEVTAPLTSKVVQLLVKPGSKVTKGQPLATIASPELANLRVDAQGKQADAQGALQKARVNLQLAQDNLVKQQTISNADVAQARTKLSAAQAQFDRDKSIVNQSGVLKVAQENLKLQRQIANAEITRANTEVAIAQEQFDRDSELVKTGALARRQMLESKGKLERAKAEAARAKSLPQVVQAQSDVKKAEVDLPYRELRASQASVAEAQSLLQRAETRRDVLEAQAQLKRAQSDVVIAQSQLNLSTTNYQTRLQQLGSTANAQGLVTITAPIAGTVASRDVSIGQSLQDAGGKLMTIVNDSRIFATANIYEKDLGLVKTGQKIRVKVASLPNQSFEGRITQIGTSVQGETRVVPVQAEIANAGGVLKPGMFAELEVITDKTTESLLAIPTSAVVDANGKKVVYVQNGNAFQAAEVTFGRTSGDMVEVKTGLFAGDMVVTQRGTQLFAQSLRGGGEKPAADEHQDEAAPAKSNGLVVPPWLLPVGGGAILVTGGVLLWKRFRSAPADDLEDGEEDAYADNYRDSLPAAELTEPEPYTNNHHSVPSSPVLMGGKSKEGAQE
ncbi:efflux RND transporter periplasmic adaptor subunit [Chamaesiphon minutus]|uniref:RND family efflux transporter, MFP subunit n=1 Tax=Chamaesiphon minutus (strain ATCC 27169 / PCC 6605) TaxID=1173020 RepID=K9UDQ6_CHAP6|nr:efflux RND transporter periplasmic adaptor subunit [Chamaesiphon minutus]AFY92965.1 RND family efflux transporter, MFP subunit [Chamaesiphon minutus PCC 6605]